MGRRSWLNYRFTATLSRRFPRRNIVFKQDVWIFSTCLPAPSLDYTPTPHTYSGVWESHLPFICSLPNENIPLGQTVPLTIRFDPFPSSSGHFGQELVIISAIVKLKQYTRLWHRWDVKTETKEVLTLPVDHDWQQSANGMQRTILVDVPHAPRLSCTTYTRPVQKSHKMKLIMRIKTATMTDKEARELRIESRLLFTCMIDFELQMIQRTNDCVLALFFLVEVNVTGARPPTDAPLEDLPSYSAVWDGEHDGDDSD